MEEHYLTIIMRAVRMVFRNLLMHSMYVDGPHRGGSVLLKEGILSLIKVNGDVKGQIRVYSNTDTASYIASKIADNHFKGTVSEIESGAGELCNLIAGAVKRMFAQRKLFFKFSCPETFHIRNKAGDSNVFPDHSYHVIVSFDPYVVYVDMSLNID